MELADAPAGWLGAGAATEIFNGHGGRVWRVSRRDGSSAILKAISPRAMENYASGTAFLRWRNGVGAAKLFASAPGWQLMEDAGTATLLSVVETRGDLMANEIAAKALANTHKSSPSPPPDALIPLRRHFRSLFDCSAQTRADDDLLGLAAETARHLLDIAEDERPLHGDFHHENLLYGQRGWIAIDPAGLFGDPGYDAANLFYNPLVSTERTSPARISNLADILQAQLGHSRDRLLRWGFSHACLSASWYLEDGEPENAAESLAVARAVADVAGLQSA